MRVLDLGAHDGFVTAFVADTFQKITRLDGVELNSHGVREFNRRLADRELNGECKQGRAEDAPDLFPLGRGTYDAVIAYELIEHVPDVDAFLDACELMCAPRGRVYISTPDGCFGEGSNPHHLRVYRSVDLADLLRRRGNLMSMAVGEDGIAVASYVPWQACDPPLGHDRGDIAIYTGPGWKEWHPLDRLRPGGLGGSETAACALAEALQALGYNVTVYGQVEPGIKGQVIYRHHDVFDPLEPRKAVIYSRSPHMLDRPTAASTFLWMHDTDYGPQPEGRLERADVVLALSDWHMEHVRKTYPQINRLVRFPNGIEPAFFRGEADERDPHCAIYSSSPDRGLDLLLEWWPEVRFHVPDARLVYCYADVYQEVAKVRPEVAAHHARTLELADQPGVTNLGALSQPDLATVMRQCGVWLHPSFNTPSGQRFYETYCIGAAEAAEAQCVRVMAGWGGLSDRAAERSLRGDMVVNAEDREVWIEAIVRGFQIADDGLPEATPATTWKSAALNLAVMIESQG